MQKVNLSPVPPPIKEDMLSILKGKMPPIFKHLVEQNKQAIQKVDKHGKP